MAVAGIGLRPSWTETIVAEGPRPAVSGIATGYRAPRLQHAGTLIEISLIDDALEILHAQLWAGGGARGRSRHERPRLRSDIQSSLDCPEPVASHGKVGARLVQGQVEKETLAGTPGERADQMVLRFEGHQNVLDRLAQSQ